MKVVASERIEALVEDLARQLSEDPPDPMTPEWIAVGSDGLQRWLQLELARHLGAQSGRSDGVTANIIFRSPGTLRTAVLLAGTDRPEFDPWLPDRLTWAVLETLQLHGSGDARLAPLTDSSTRTVYRRAMQIAERFSAYQTHRPEMIRAWHLNDDLDAAGRPLPDSQSWQPHLWRLVRNHVGVQSPAERLVTALDAVRAGTVELTLNDDVLPPRLVFFGPSLLPTGAGFLEVAEAVAAHRDVIVYVIEPSGSLSSSLRSSASELTSNFNRAHDVSADLADHPLLRSWGRLQRETALLLSGLPVQTLSRLPMVDDTLLHALQSDLHNNSAPAGAFEVTESDRSIELHRCYGPTRQVEALRDTLLGLLNDPDLDLSEDDIIVACPALATFAPLIGAVFGPNATDAVPRAADGSPLLRYRITGLSGEDDNPVTEGLLAAMRLTTGRFDVTDFAEFLALTAVRNRFGWTDDDLDILYGWLDDTNIRWGLDGQHRARFGMPADVESFTLRTAVDQLLIGTAVRSAEGSAIGDVVPVRFGADDPALVGQFAAILNTFEHLTADSLVPRPVTEWFDILNGVLDRLVAPDTGAEWQLDSTRRLLARIIDHSRLAGNGTASDGSGRPETSRASLSFGELTQMIEDVVGEQRGRSDFFRGGVTVTTLNALRNVPARVICILGADQAAFSVGGVSSDDLIGINPRLGDRDRRAEVRQSLLDALLAAGERFIVFSDGFDVRTNSEIPPAVVISELLDTIDLTCSASSASKALVRVHPRQSFAESYFDSTAASGRSFNRGALKAAQARRARNTEEGEVEWPSVVLTHPVADRGDHIEIDTLKGVLTDPTRVFLHDGLGIRLPGQVDTRSPELPLEGDGLGDWKLGTSLMELLRENRPVTNWADRQVRLGNLPPLSLATERISSLQTEAERINALAMTHGVQPGEPTVVPVEFDLDDGRRLTGQAHTTLGGDKRGVSLVLFSKDNPKYLLKAWVDLLALTVADDSEPWQAVIVNRTSAKPTKKNPDPDPAVARLHTGNLDAATAREALTFIAEFYDTAIRQPVPFFPKVFGPTTLHDPKENDWRNDKYPLSPEVLYVYGDISLDELREITATGHPLIDSRLPLADAYADRVWGLFGDTVVIAGQEDDDV